MKHQYSKFILTICAWFICTTFLLAQYITPVRTMSIPPTIDKIIFDGVDNESSYSAAQTLTMFNSSGYSGIQDFGGYFKSSFALKTASLSLLGYPLSIFLCKYNR